MKPLGEVDIARLPEIMGTDAQYAMMEQALLISSAVVLGYLLWTLLSYPFVDYLTKNLIAALISFVTLCLSYLYEKRTFSIIVLTVGSMIIVIIRIIETYKVKKFMNERKEKIKRREEMREIHRELRKHIELKGLELVVEGKTYAASHCPVEVPAGSTVSIWVETETPGIVRQVVASFSDGTIVEMEELSIPWRSAGFSRFDIFDKEYTVTKLWVGEYTIPDSVPEGSCIDVTITASNWFGETQLVQKHFLRVVGKKAEEKQVDSNLVISVTTT